MDDFTQMTASELRVALYILRRSARFYVEVQPDERAAAWYTAAADQAAAELRARQDPS
jgi:hypothetical protein